MTYSDKLNGFWEEGYHYYIEIRDGGMTVRDYRRRVMLETRIEYDAELLESGARTVITPEDTVLSRDAYGELFTMIRELAYENGELKLLYYYTIMGETLYTLHKVDHGPFAHIIIRDDEFLPGLQGEWVEWSRNGRHAGRLVIEGDRLTLPFGDAVPIHVVSYTYDKNRVRIVPADLTRDDFGSYTDIEVHRDRLTTRMMICDASVPLSIFARKEMLDKISIPEEARRPVVSTMMPDRPAADMPLFGKPWIAQPEPPKTDGPKPEGAVYCPECGYKIGPERGKFCPECGSPLPDKES